MSCSLASLCCSIRSTNSSILPQSVATLPGCLFVLNTNLAISANNCQQLANGTIKWNAFYCLFVCLFYRCHMDGSIMGTFKSVSMETISLRLAHLALDIFFLYRLWCQTCFVHLVIDVAQSHCKVICRKVTADKNHSV